MLTMYHPRTRWKRAALGSLALFSGVLGTLLRRASGEISNCQDLLTPAYQSDWNSGLVPLGPALDTGFFDTANDALRVRVMTSPGIGTTDKSAFTRTLEIVLSGPDAISFDGAATAVSSGCWTSWPRFSLQFPPPNIAVLSTTVMISNEISANCSFYHVLSMPWQAFTSSGLAYCGFQAGDLVNGMRNFSGRVHVRWSDFDQLDSTMPIYGPNEMFYDARLGISELGQASAGPVLVLAPTMTSTLTRTRSKTKSSTTQSVTKTVSLTTTATTTDVDFSSTSFTRTTKTTYTKTTDFCHPTFPAEVPAIIYPWTDWTWLPSSFPPQACTSVSGLCGHDMAFRTSGRPIQIVDRIYGHGWGVPRSGQVLLRVNERCGNLEFTTGLDYSSGAFAGAVFEVWTDGIQISRSPYTMRDSPGRKHRIDLLGVRNVTLVVKGSGKANAVFADPILSCGPMSPFLPSVVIEPIGFDGNWGTPGQKVQFRATALDRLGRNLGPGSMKWALRVGYCTATQCEILPTIRGPISRGVDAAFSLPLVAAGCRFYFVRAEVVDSCGAKNFASWSIKIPGRCGFAQARFPDQKPDRVKKTMRPVQTDQTVAW